jgi:hypothetical protein
MKTQVSNTPFFLLPLFAVLFLITSCGSFSPVGYYNDGIYGDTPPSKKNTPRALMASIIKSILEIWQ